MLACKCCTSRKKARLAEKDFGRFLQLVLHAGAITTADWKIWEATVAHHLGWAWNTPKSPCCLGSSSSPRLLRRLLPYDLSRLRNPGNSLGQTLFNTGGSVERTGLQAMFPLGMGAQEQSTTQNQRTQKNVEAQAWKSMKTAILRAYSVSGHNLCTRTEWKLVSLQQPCKGNASPHPATAQFTDGIALTP